VHKDMNQLYELQQIDSAIAELEADLKALDDGSELRVQLAAAEEEQARRKATYAGSLGEQKKREADLAKAEQKRKQLMDRAYGGTIVNPKELETLEKEIESLSRMKDRIETELLELFDQVDEEKRLAEEQEKAVDELRTRLSDTVTTYASERARLTDEVAKLRVERGTAQQPLDEEILRKYEYLRGRCANVAVVAVEGGTCSGCRIGLPLVQANRLARNPELQQCENCLRLLWMAIEEDEE